MKFLHTSDWHLGAQQRNANLQEDQEYFINQICSVIKEEQVNAIIIAGDIFDHSIGSAEAVALYDYAMTRLCLDVKVPVIVVAGNHDSAERLSTCSRLLEKSGLFIAGSLQKEIVKVSFADSDIYLLPWFRTDRVRAIYGLEQDELASTEEAFAYVLNKMKEDFVPGKKHILVSHAFIRNAETSTSDRSAEVGMAAAVSATLFEDFDYVALGHIHGPQNITDKIRYCGTPMAYSFGREERQQKSVTVVDTDNMEQKIITLPPLHLRKTIRGKLDEILSSVYSREEIEGYVRLEVTDVAIGHENIERLRAVFDHPLEILGKNYDSVEESKISLINKDLGTYETKPEIIFEHFCQDIMKQAPSEHQIKLFREALEACTKEADEE